MQAHDSHVYLQAVGTALPKCVSIAEISKRKIPVGLRSSYPFASNRLDLEPSPAQHCLLHQVVLAEILPAPFAPMSSQYRQGDRHLESK